MANRVRVNDVELCAESFGDAADPAVLLIAGSGGAMDWWPVEFRDRIAAGGRFVIRYDHRDTGQSITYPPGEPGYSGEDLVADIIGLLDAFDRPSAHLVGLSMGGALAQQVTLNHPERVASLTLIATTSVGPGTARPPMTDELRAFYEQAGEVEWTDRAAVVDHILAEDRALSGSRYWDEAARRGTVTRVVDRSADIAAKANHDRAHSTSPWRQRLGEIRVPTLVIHGADDPLFPLGHGQALAAEIPPAELITLADVGHEMPPPPTWDVVVPAILRLTSSFPGAGH
jgi:pimeloyl-ACP methyl ester carboxylesterase